jgi:hypothetical protein
LLRQTRRSVIEFDASDNGEKYTFKTTGEALKTAIAKVFTNERIQHNFSDGQRNFQVKVKRDINSEISKLSTDIEKIKPALVDISKKEASILQGEKVS